MDPRSAKPNRRPYHLHLIVRACGSAVVATLFGVIALAFAIACAPRIVEAAPLTTYTWTGTGSGGVWQNGSLGHFDTVYSNSPSSAATFTGTAETVTVSGTVEAAALTFLTGGYMLSGGTVAFAAGQITTTPGITTIDSALSGSGTLSVGGTGTLHLGSDSRRLPLLRSR